MTKKSLIFILVSNVLLFVILFAMLNYEGQTLVSSLRLKGSVSLENEGVMYVDEAEMETDIQYLSAHDYNYIFYKPINDDKVVEMTCRNYELVIDYDCSSNTTKTIDGITYAPLTSTINEIFIKVEGVPYSTLVKELGWEMSVMSSVGSSEFTEQMKISFILLMLLLCLVYAYLIVQLILKHLNVLILIGINSWKVHGYFMIRFTVIQALASSIVYIINYKYFTNYVVYEQFVHGPSPAGMLLLCNLIVLVFNALLLAVIIARQLNEFTTLEEIEL